jgi:hypothetical protein
MAEGSLLLHPACPSKITPKRKTRPTQTGNARRENMAPPTMKVNVVRHAPQPQEKAPRKTRKVRQFPRMRDIYLY